MSGARWEVWGTYAFLAVDDPAALGTGRRYADRFLDRVDRACSRFRSDSDLSRANAEPGQWVDVDPLLVAAVDAALGAAAATDGLVDPCLGRAMRWLGYDRDLALVRATTPPWARADDDGRSVVRPGAWREVGLAEDAIRVPPGVELDLGASAKAWAADLLAEELAARLGCTVVVSLGGDLRVVGAGDRGWPVRVTEHPEDDDGVDVVVAGGLATSTTVVRRWRTPRAPERHHLLDPRTGLPAAAPYRTVTAAGSTCLAANTAATAALVSGPTAPAWLEQRGVTARLVGQDARVRTTGCWPDDAWKESA